MIKVHNGKDGSVKATFSLPLSEAPHAVSVLGDFNEWEPDAHPLRKRSNGTRSTSVVLSPGRRYEFKYLAEGGTWFTEPEAGEQVRNEYGETNSVLQT